ncbi:MAG TPA: hypothetical protein VHP83_09185 [Aggregatilineaceae bacterium]|nr:hypothetical protein [Aggregatilineaceae bacterium]
MAKYKPLFEMITSLGFAAAALLILLAVALAQEGIEGLWMVAAAFAELGLLTGGVWLAYRYVQHRTGRTRLLIVDDEGLKAKRSLGEEGELVILSYDPGTRLFTFQGRGSQVMDQPVHLTASLYRLKYDCSAVKIKLAEVDQDVIIPLMDVTGRGSQSFAVEADGRYVFQVECRPAAKWRIECVQL